MDTLDSPGKEQKEKLFSIRHLALFLTTLLWLFSIIQLLNYFRKGYEVFMDNQLIAGLIVIPIVYLSVLLKGRIWFYLFLILLLLFTFQKIEFFSYISLTIKLFGIQFNILGLLFFILHVGLNTDYIQPKQKDESEESKINEAKIQFFENQFTRKTKEELEAVNTEDLVEEAKIALKNVLKNKRESSV